MGLDITFKTVKDVKCPHCGEMLKQEIVEAVNSGGRCWFNFLESIGYYTPYERRDEDFVDVWYGEDKQLDSKQVETLFNNLPKEAYNKKEIECAIALAIAHKHHIVVNADW